MEKNDDPIGNLINTKHLKISYMLVGYILAIVVVAWFVYWIVIFGWLNVGYETIGSWFEKKEYSTQYWVYIQPDGPDSKNYRVKGDIDRVSGEDSEYYLLNKIYWPSGASSTFSSCDITSTIKNNAVENCTVDGEDMSYTIRLGEKVKD